MKKGGRGVEASLTDCIKGTPARIGIRQVRKQVRLGPCTRWA
jgi:hypothetical protein